MVNQIRSVIGWNIFFKINGMFLPSQRIVTALFLVSSIPRIFKEEGSKPHLNPPLYISQSVTLFKSVKNFRGNNLLELSYFWLINLYIHFSYVSFFTCVRYMCKNKRFILYILQYVQFDFCIFSQYE